MYPISSRSGEVRLFEIFPEKLDDILKNENSNLQRRKSQKGNIGFPSNFPLCKKITRCEGWTLRFGLFEDQCKIPNRFTLNLDTIGCLSN
jgi:hypothetical protein